MSSAPLPLSPTKRAGRSLGSRHESTLAVAVTVGFPGVRLRLAALPATPAHMAHDRPHSLNTVLAIRPRMTFPLHVTVALSGLLDWPCRSIGEQRTARKAGN